MAASPVERALRRSSFRVFAIASAFAWSMAALPLGAQPAADRSMAGQTAVPVPVRPWNVVVLNPGDADLPAFRALGEGLQSTLTAPGQHPVNVFTEPLDMLRFPYSRFESELAALFKRKYADVPVDAVVTLGIPTYAFAERHIKELWPNARIFFDGIPATYFATRTLAPTTAGIPIEHDLAGIAELALQLQPDVRRLIVIAGAGDFDSAMRGMAANQLASLGKRLAIEYWDALPLDTLRQRVASLGPGDAGVLLVFSRDPGGQVFMSPQVLEDITRGARVPIYATFETYMGHGAIGGKVHNLALRGRRLGRLVLEGLAANPGARTGMLPPAQTGCVADARILARFGIDEARLPAGCEVLFREASLWRDYRAQVLGAAFLILGQAALIMLLVLQRRGRRKAEATARRHRAELEQASRLALAGELSASIAHEINQPLGAIVANAEAAESLLGRGPAAHDELHSALVDIRRAGLRASEIIVRVRALIEKRKGEPALLDVNDVIRDVVGFLRGEANRRGVAVETALAPGLPRVQLDRVQMQQAFVNLCINAFEAMNNASRRRLIVETARAGGGGVDIRFSDTGPGMSSEVLAGLFETFFTAKVQGTGLGLSITRSIVEVHGGTLSATNRESGGAQFTIHLPRETTEHDQSMAPQPPKRASGSD
jgi:signal transduction histidine kinase